MGDPHNSNIQASDGLIVQIQVVLLDVPHEFITQGFTAHVLALLLQRNALEDALRAFSAVPVNSHAAHLAAVNAIYDAAEEGLATDGAVGGEHGTVEDLLLKVMGLLWVGC